MKHSYHRRVELLRVCFIVPVALAIGMVVALTATAQAAHESLSEKLPARHPEPVERWLAPAQSRTLRRAQDAQSVIRIGSKPQGTAITVTDTDDDNIPNGNCTLREAVLAANTDSAIDSCPAGDGIDTIILPSGSYSLTLVGSAEDAGLTGDLDITASATISGTGAANTIVDAHLLDDRIFDIDPTQAAEVNVSLIGLTIHHGGAGMGGGILNSGALTVKDSAVTDCSSASGAGIFNRGTLTLTNSIVSGNIVGLLHGGPGGIRNEGQMVIRDSLITRNGAYGCGGVYNGGTMTITNSTVFQNGAQYQGGVCNGGDLTILNSTVAENDAIFAAGISNSSKLTVGNTLIYSNTAGTGGGVLNYRGTLVITNSTVSDNKATTGGGILVENGLVTLYNVTIANNVANKSGYGPFDGGGLQRSTGFTGTVVLHNSVVAGNLRLAPGGAVFADCIGAPGAIVSAGHNLIGAADGCHWEEATGDQVGSSAAPIDPILAPLADNGGPTLTHALLFNSPAINTGDSDGCPPVDQRGYFRRDGRCDIGAYEYRASSFIPTGYLYLPLAFR